MRKVLTLIMAISLALTLQSMAKGKGGPAEARDDRNAQGPCDQ